jgi:hypothetical protein
MDSDPLVRITDPRIPDPDPYQNVTVQVPASSSYITSLYPACSGSGHVYGDKACSVEIWPDLIKLTFYFNFWASLLQGNLEVFRCKVTLEDRFPSYMGNAQMFTVHVVI